VERQRSLDSPAAAELDPSAAGAPAPGEATHLQPFALASRFLISNPEDSYMDGKDRLLYLWRWLRLPTDAIGACSKDYDLLCPYCRVAGRGEVHLRILNDDSGFRCVGIGHEYRWSAPHIRCATPRKTEHRTPAFSDRTPVFADMPQALSA